MSNSKPRNDYDAVKDQRKRRKPKIERQQEGQSLSGRGRLKGMALSRDLLRNFTAAKSLDHQKRINVVGSGPKLKLHIEDQELAQEVCEWFNEVWQKDADSRDDNHYADLLQQELSSIGTDGGCIKAFDNFDRNDGRLLYWNLDQLVTIEEQDWQSDRHKWKEGGKKNRKPMHQKDGIVRDKRGRVMAYVVHPTPGKNIAPLDEVTILPRGTARMIHRPWRLNQVIPTPEYLPMAADLEDLYEMRASELQTAKRMAQEYGWVVSESKEEELDLQNDQYPEGSQDAEDAAGDTENSVTKDNYEALEARTGGHVDYLDPDDQVNIHSPERPNDKIQEFFDHCLYGAAASIGLANVHADLKAKNNFTAFRGEMLISWATFRVDQKFLERRSCDWTAVKVLNWAQQRRKFTLPSGWERKIAWAWPRMPVLDPSKEYRALIDAQKAGAIDLQDILGPDWEQKLEDMAKQLKKAQDLEIPLGAFETAAGAMSETDDSEQNENNTEDE